MTKTTINWGILGCGRIARKFATDLPFAGNAKLVAAASRDLRNAQDFAKEFGADNSYGSYEELVHDKNVDAIYVATPHSHHHEHTLLCLNNDKAVLCEKAFAVNSWQAREMVDAARARKVFLMEALWSKFLPHQQRMEKMVREGKIGEIQSILVNFGFRPQYPIPPRLFDPALAGGTLLDIGIYNVFVATSVLGKPDQIEAHMTPASTGVDEQCAILFRYKSGAMAQLFSTFSSDLATEAHINGTKGRIRLTHRFYAPDSVIEYYEGKPDSFEIIDTGVAKEGFGYQYEARHVGECLFNQLTESKIVSLDDTLERMQLLDEIRMKAGIKYPEDH
ncbi:MAG: Gfo/Idh/MocA family oxidoreductase [Chitinophagaceae bacterium]|nr:Gfo/Idh/MocA family oxidoreductase [Chitinophagaceae bacterium]